MKKRCDMNEEIHDDVTLLLKVPTICLPLTRIHINTYLTFTAYLDRALGTYLV